MALSLFDQTIALLADLEAAGVEYALAGALAAELVERRLRRSSALANLQSLQRLEAKIPMTARAVTARLRAQSAARDACLAWGRSGAAALAGGRSVRRRPDR